MRKTPFMLSILVFAILHSSALSQGQATPLAKNGKSLLPVVVAKDAPPGVRQAADNLAAYLGKISGARFEVIQGDGSKGIVVGLPGQFARVPFQDKWQKPAMTQREDYLLRSHPQGVHVLGATELAVKHAVWDVLHRLGYRQFFPGKTWEVIPKISDLSIAVNAEESPDYHSRRIWYGFGTWDYNAQPYADWCAKNRAVAGLKLNTGHSYVGIIRSNQKQFDMHPEFYALVKGQRNTKPLAQLCISNPGLRKLVVQHALDYFDRNPDADSISMDPNDGGGHCECEHCAKMGSISDRVLTLANEVAEAINQKHGDKYVGMYAYASHSPPPNIKVHPKVVVSVATSFIRGGYKLDELISGWNKQGATLGIREYYSVHTWDRDLPGKARGGRLDYLKKTIPDFHAKGARFMSAESSDNWGPNGLGYYLAARLLWDVKEAKKADAIIDDFLTRAFGPAREPMREFYQLLDGSEEYLLVEDHLGKMYRALDQARKLATDDDIRARIDELLLYTCYVDLFHQYSAARGQERQAAFEKLIKHGYRMRKTMLIHVKGLYRDLAARDKSVTIPAEAGWNVAEAKNPWKGSEPFSEQELQTYLAEGIKNNQIVKLDFEPVTFSENLIPLGKLNLPGGKSGAGVRGRGTQTFYTFVDKAPATLKLNITGGLIAHYRDRGNVRVELWTVGDNPVLVTEDRSVPPDGKEREVTLKVNEPGQYQIKVSDGGDMTQVDWPLGTPITFKSSLQNPLQVSGRWSLYFYVPKGTKTVGLFGGGTGDFIDPQGKKIFSLNGKQLGYHSIPVPPGADGQLWKIQNSAGPVRLLTVPPYLARTGEELLLPAEVVNRDVK